MKSIRVGIDPGTRTGLTFYNLTTKKIELCNTFSIVGAMKEIEGLVAEKTNVEVWFEDARKRTWIPKQVGRERLQGAGSIKRDCAIWEEFCSFHGIRFRKVAPKNISTKLNKDVFARVTGWDKRVSVHARDSAMIVYGG